MTDWSVDDGPKEGEVVGEDEGMSDGALVGALDNGPLVGGL